MHRLISKFTLRVAPAFLAASLIVGVGLAPVVAGDAGDKVSEQSPNAASSTTQPDESWRKNPPVLPGPRPFKAPDVVSYMLDNGLNVELVEDHRVPFITAELGIKAGASHDPAALHGLSSLTASMVTEGTSDKTSKQIAEETDFIGGGLKAASDADFTLFVGSSLSKYTDRLFDLFSDVLLHPSFPQNEFKLKQTNLLQELVMKRSDPDFLLDERFSKAVFGDHPYSVVAPTPENVKAITTQELKNFAAKYYVPNESVLIVVGDFQTPKMKELVSKEFSSWKRSPIADATCPNMPKLSGRHVCLVDRPGSVQSCLKMGNVCIKKTDPGYFPLLVANQILGGGGNSRLFINIREQKGYTYGAYSSFSARKDPGAFVADADVRTEVTEPSLKEFVSELNRIRTTDVTDKELKDAKTYLAGSFQLGLETQSGLAQRLLECQLYDLPKNYLETYTDQVMAVTPQQVREVADKYMDLNNMVITVVGDGKKIKDGLKQFGTVEVYDTSGNIEKGNTASAEKPGISSAKSGI
jgi:zinc protease